MPYKDISKLPSGVKDNLPKHAQEIYLATFNNSLDEYDGDEETARRVAWASVKQKYEKQNNSWVPKNN